MSCNNACIKAIAFIPYQLTDYDCIKQQEGISIDSIREVEKASGKACRCQQINLPSRFEYVIDELIQRALDQQREQLPEVLDITWSSEYENVVMMIADTEGMTIDAWVNIYVSLMAKMGMDVYKKRCDALPVSHEGAMIWRTFQRRGMLSMRQQKAVIEEFIQCRHDVDRFLNYCGDHAVLEQQEGGLENYLRFDLGYDD